MTPLHSGAYNGNIAVGRLLMGRHADVAAKDSLGRTPLDCARLRGHTKFTIPLHTHANRDALHAVRPTLKKRSLTK